MTLPLEGIRVADFSWVVAGPFSTMILAAMGAEVIKIESSVHTDVNRRLPPFADGEGTDSIERSGLFHSLNLSKQSCAINLTTTQGQEIALDLVRQSDVVVENFAYGQMDRFNLGWERLRTAKPDLIMVSSSGLGRTGPQRQYVTFGPPLIALTGLASITGQLGGEPERLIGGIWADHLSGLTAGFHLLAALEHRAETGEGQLLEYSMAEVTMAQMPEAFIDFTRNGHVWGRQGNRDRVFAPHGFFPCAGDDQWVAIAVDSEAAWRALCDLMGRGDWVAANTLASAEGRRAEENVLEQELASWTARQDRDELVDRLQAVGVPAAAAASADDLVADPQLREFGFYQPIQHPEVGVREHATFGWQLSGVEPRIESAPLLGQDTLPVCSELLGLSDAEFAELVASGSLL